MAKTKIPYDILHKIDAKYHTLIIPDDDPLMIKLHKALGVTVEEKRSSNGYQSHSYDNEAIILARKGYSVDQIAEKIGHNSLTIRKILLHFKIPIMKSFIGQYQNIYIATMQNLKKWNINARNRNYARRKTNGGYKACNKRLYELNNGDKYMIAGNNTKVFIKK